MEWMFPYLGIVTDPRQMAQADYSDQVQQSAYQAAVKQSDLYARYYAAQMAWQRTIVVPQGWQEWFAYGDELL